MALFDNERLAVQKPLRIIIIKSPRSHKYDVKRKRATVKRVADAHKVVSLVRGPATKATQCLWRCVSDPPT